MEKVIRQDDCLDNLFALLEETFENTHGIYLDRDTSLLKTLESISAAEASIPSAANARRSPRRLHT